MSRSPASILYDEAGNALSVVDGKLQIDATATLSASSPKVLESADLLEGILTELRCIRTLLEILTDEHVGEGDIGHAD